MLRRGLAFLISVIFVLAVSLAQANGPGGQPTCSSVELELDLRQVRRALFRIGEPITMAEDVEFARVDDVLFLRVKKLPEHGVVGDRNLSVSRTGSQFTVESGLSCPEAIDFVKSQLAKYTLVEVGIVGESPIFSTPDFKSRVERSDDYVHLRLRTELLKQFENFTRRHIGKSIYIRIDDSAPITYRIRAAIGSGAFQIERSELPADFEQDFLLPYRLEIEGCGRCESVAEDARAEPGGRRE